MRRVVVRAELDGECTCIAYQSAAQTVDSRKGERMCSRGQDHLK